MVFFIVFETMSREAGNLCRMRIFFVFCFWQTLKPFIARVIHFHTYLSKYSFNQYIGLNAFSILSPAILN